MTTMFFADVFTTRYGPVANDGILFCTGSSFVGASRRKNLNDPSRMSSADGLTAFSMSALLRACVCRRFPLAVPIRVLRRAKNCSRSRLGLAGRGRVLDSQVYRRSTDRELQWAKARSTMDLCVVAVRDGAREAVPVVKVLRHIASQGRENSAVLPLHLTVGLWVVRHREQVLNSQSLTDRLKNVWP